MGRTVPSYRLASEREKRKWKIFGLELDKLHPKQVKITIDDEI